MWFQVHYPTLIGFLLIFRSRYLFAIGHQRVFSLAGWSPQIQTGFHVAGPTQVSNKLSLPFTYGTFTVYGATFQTLWLGILSLKSDPTTPTRNSSWFRLYRFRSPLLTESIFLSFPSGTEMFQFSEFAAYTYVFSVSSFRYPGLNACLTAPPGLSQFSAPFIVFWCQDIPHMPLVIWTHRSRLLLFMFPRIEKKQKSTSRLRLILPAKKILIKCNDP